MFLDPEYVAWANEKTIHVLSYDLDPAAEKPEPTIEVERDGEKVPVLAMYPMFTPNEAELLVREVNAAFKFPTKTPWAGVIGTDGKTILASHDKKGTAKEFRDLYETELAKLKGPFLSRDDWKKIAGHLKDSTEAEFDDRFADSVKAANAARAVAKAVPPALDERIRGRFDALHAVRKAKTEEAEKTKDAAKRQAALEKVAKDFADLPPEATPTPPAK